MPAIQFRTGLDDKIAHACGWLKKAVERGARVRVIGPTADLQALDEALWVADAQSFIPHARAGAAQAPHRTPIWLGDGDIPLPAPSLLLNLGADVPAALDGYERVIELVSHTPDDVQAGRLRWAAYKRRGLEPKHLIAEADSAPSRGES